MFRTVGLALVGGAGGRSAGVIGSSVSITSTPSLSGEASALARALAGASAGAVFGLGCFVNFFGFGLGFALGVFVLAGVLLRRATDFFSSVGLVICIRSMSSGRSLTAMISPWLIFNSRSSRGSSFHRSTRPLPTISSILLQTTTLLSVRTSSISLLNRRSFVKMLMHWASTSSCERCSGCSRYISVLWSK